ncbi:hypothetical protein C3432_21500 [Citrobacter amalonaticus]|uniref:Uncharacterized protein n=1 Tax=Citrobacter amalonaticus TaxID=35703 RepID=A0A2S4RV80_CITAM|nr:hypothetical protein [Citrobacter amalonaticus]POT55618.1 hypothetical protein C3432_21500 [Citrobacter amalonaticus]POT73830.1 hypothetical protein C3436_18965 [Citrobacter amalonaticus]POU64055.1 hypothetical protein C3430_17900 [Citrobacter amalonaticus]POV03687.1 hypothetical protein C3424_20815 [Citrobacter amalonaticus]
MYFYQGNKKRYQYICEHQIWVLGRVIGIYNQITHKNEEMLEPLWRKYDSDIEGISLFCSKMEAAFYSTYLEENFNEKWDVYPLDDFNIKEMMMHNYSTKKTHAYNLLLSAGFWANKDNKIIRCNCHLVQATIPITYNSGAITKDSEYPILEIPENVTEKFNKMWKRRYANFISHTKSQCNYHSDYLKEQSLIAFKNIKIKEFDEISDCVYLATWDNDWIFCNPDDLIK